MLVPHAHAYLFLRMKIVQMMLITRSPTPFQFRSNLQPHSHEDEYHRDAFGVQPVINTHAHHADQLGLPSITIHEQHLLIPSTYISSRARIYLPFYQPFSPTSVLSSPLHLLSAVNCPLTIRFLAHRPAKFEVHPKYIYDDRTRSYIPFDECRQWPSPRYRPTPHLHPHSLQTEDR